MKRIPDKVHPKLHLALGVAVRHQIERALPGTPENLMRAPNPCLDTELLARKKGLPSSRLFLSFGPGSSSRGDSPIGRHWYEKSDIRSLRKGCREEQPNREPHKQVAGDPARSLVAR